MLDWLFSMTSRISHLLKPLDPTWHIVYIGSIIGAYRFSQKSWECRLRFHHGRDYVTAVLTEIKGDKKGPEHFVHFRHSHPDLQDLGQAGKTTTPQFVFGAYTGPPGDYAWLSDYLRLKQD